MQTLEIYKWAKAELERYKKSADYSDISEHYCSFIECELLPKLEESLHTSTNSKSTQGCSECGCRISLRGYCAGCQSRVDW
jgi:hypothetical protein